MKYALLGIASAGLAALLAGCGGTAVLPETMSEPMPSAVSVAVEPVVAATSVALIADDSSAESSEAESSEAEPSSSVRNVTFDDIKFEMKKEEKFKQRMLTDKIKDLFGKNIRIRGYILPSFKQNGLTHFVLVRDNMECCFGPGAALYDCIVVKMVEGRTASFSARPVTVEGKFSFEKLEDPIDGALRAIYHMDAVSVK